MPSILLSGHSEVQIVKCTESSRSPTQGAGLNNPKQACLSLLVLLGSPCYMGYQWVCSEGKVCSGGGKKTLARQCRQTGGRIKEGRIGGTPEDEVVVGNLQVSGASSDRAAAGQAHSALTTARCYPGLAKRQGTPSEPGRRRNRVGAVDGGWVFAHRIIPGLPLQLSDNHI